MNKITVHFKEHFGFNKSDKIILELPYLAIGAKQDDLLHQLSKKILSHQSEAQIIKKLLDTSLNMELPKEHREEAINDYKNALENLELIGVGRYLLKNIKSSYCETCLDTFNFILDLKEETLVIDSEICTINSDLELPKTEKYYNVFLKSGKIIKEDSEIAVNDLKFNREPLDFDEAENLVKNISSQMTKIGADNIIYSHLYLIMR